MKTIVKNLTASRLLNATLVFIVLMTAVSCASTSRTPAWLTSPGDVYPENQYLTAIGSGNSLQAAQNNAIANLARIFRADVRADQTLVDDYIETMRNEDVDLERVTSLISTTRIESNMEMLNVQTYETHRSGDTYYVLSGFERLRTSTIYSREMTNNEMQIDELRSRVSAEQSIIRKMALLRSALIVSEVNENLSKQRDQILNRSVPFNSEVEQRLEIEREIEELSRQATIRLRTADDFPGELEGAMKSVFQEMGFTIGESVTDPLLDVHAQFIVEDTDLGRDDAVFKHWSVIIDITDNQTRTDFRQFFHEDRAGAASEDQATRRSARDARNVIERPFKSFVDQQLRSLLN